jgi:hypothetical protein
MTLTRLTTARKKLLNKMKSKACRLNQNRFDQEVAPLNLVCAAGSFQILKLQFWSMSLSRQRRYQDKPLTNVGQYFMLGCWHSSVPALG